MKKMITMLLVLSVLLALAGCRTGKKRTVSEKNNSGTQISVEEKTGTSSRKTRAKLKEEFEPLQVEKSEWFMNAAGYLEYYIILRNPNQNIAVKYPDYRVTARDRDGNVLASEDGLTLYMLYPGRCVTCTGISFQLDEVPDSVEFQALEPNEYDLISTKSQDSYIPLEFTNLNIRERNITGEVKNPNDYKLERAEIIVLFRDKDGNLTDIKSTEVKDLQAGGNTPFSVSYYSDIDFESIECFANPW